MGGAVTAAGLADGWWIWGLFLVLGFFGLAYAYFTEAGSGIRFRAWTNAGDAPGALGYGNAAGRDPAADVRTWTRGTSARRRKRNVPVARAAAELEDRAGDDIIAKLGTWRARMNASGTALSEPVDAAVDHVLGPADAPLQIVEYTDFECPSCQAAAPVLQRLRADLGDELCVVVRHFPIADAHLNSLEAAETLEAAAAQGLFWPLHDRVYKSRRPPDRATLRRSAAKVGVDLARLQSDLEEHVHAARVRRDFESGLLSGVNGTPTFYVNGERYDGDADYESLRAALEQARPAAAAVG